MLAALSFSCTSVDGDPNSSVTKATFGLKTVGDTGHIAHRLVDQANRASAVVFGTVTAKEHDLGEDGRPWTLYTIQPDSVLSGQLEDDRLTVRCLGGPNEHGGYLRISGTPAPEVGEDWLIFYNADDPVCQIVDWEEGAFIRVTVSEDHHVLTDPQGNIMRITEQDWERVGRTVIPPPPSAPPGVTRPQTLETTVSAEALAQAPDFRDAMARLTPLCASNSARARTVKAAESIVGTFRMIPAGEPSESPE